MTERNQLKNDIIAYFSNAGITDKALVNKALGAIKDAAFYGENLDEDMLKEKHIRDYVKPLGFIKGQEFYFSLSRNFSPRHYMAIVQFVKRLEDIEEAEAKAEFDIEQKIEEEIYEQIMDPLSDGFYDELGAPDFAICIYDCHIEVRAYEKGVGDKLPKKGRKYIGSQGDMRWSFPLSMLDELKRCDRPIVNVAAFTK
jgi:hypothetical protein